MIKNAKLLHQYFYKNTHEHVLINSKLTTRIGRKISAENSKLKNTMFSTHT